MKKVLLIVVALAALTCGHDTAKGQAIKINLPTTVVGTPNIGVEVTVSQQFSINGDVLWAPYMFKKRGNREEEVFRSLIGTVELRYYTNPKYYYTNDMFDGFYFGPYAMMGNFNIGLDRHKQNEFNRRYEGWGMSGGVTLGYKFYLSTRLRMDMNLGLGYAHLQYDVYRLGGENAEYPLAKKDTKAWIGPTKFGAHLVFNLFR